MQACPKDFGATFTVLPPIRDPKGASGAIPLELAARQYPILGMICSGESIMTKWKWMLATRLPAKVFVLNENSDYFWLDWGHLRVMAHFALFRVGLTGAAAVPAIARLLFFPVTLTYLLIYAGVVHLRRRIRIL